MGARQEDTVHGRILQLAGSSVPAGHRALAAGVPVAVLCATRKGPSLQAQLIYSTRGGFSVALPPGCWLPDAQRRCTVTSRLASSRTSRGGSQQHGFTPRSLSSPAASAELVSCTRGRPEGAHYHSTTRTGYCQYTRTIRCRVRPPGGAPAGGRAVASGGHAREGNAMEMAKCATQQRGQPLCPARTIDWCGEASH